MKTEFENSIRRFNFLCHLLDIRIAQDTQNAQISKKQDGDNIYVIIKTMYPPDYHLNGFIATHAFG